MNTHLKSPTTAEMFKEKYVKKLPAGFHWQYGSFQVYPLMSDYLRVPTPLLLTDYNCLFYIQAGNIVMQIGPEKIKVTGPALIYISTGTIISFEKIPQKLKGYFVLLGDEMISTIFNNETALNLFTIHPVIDLHEQESSWMGSVCSLLFEETGKPFLNNPVSHGLLQALLFKILGLSGSEKSLTRTQQVAIHFQQLVHKHYIAEKGASFYANALAVSENYLNRCVKAVFGRSAKEMIIQVAILNSRFLMWNTSKPIADICYELNFADPSYFSRIFKKVTGQTPTEYRAFILHDLS